MEKKEQNIKKNILSYISDRKAEKIAGKKTPIIYNKDELKIENIHKYRYYSASKKEIAVGYEFLIFFGELKNQKEKIHLMGKIIGRSSSDFMAILAKKIIKRPEFKDFLLIQYPLEQDSQILKLIVLSELSNSIVKLNYLTAVEENLSALEEKFENFRLIFRKEMNNIIESYLTSD
ncbi:MAG: hypothetical protein GY870_07095 [archaeon]|nr:hypothetical protein [archaeon]